MTTAKKNTGPSVQCIYESIFMALDEYMDRHNGQGPAQITVTLPVYAQLMRTTFMNYRHGCAKFCNIPVVVAGGDGYHIHLAEPEIPLYEPTKDGPAIVMPEKEG